MDEGRNLFDLGGLLADLKDELQQDVDVVEARCVHPYIRQRVLAEAVNLQKRPGAVQDVELAHGSQVPLFAALRATSATLLIDSGVPIEAVQDLPEHKQITTTQI